VGWIIPYSSEACDFDLAGSRLTNCGFST